MAIAEILPFAGKRVIAVLLGKRFIPGECLNQFDELFSQHLTVMSLGLALQVALELTGLLNLKFSLVNRTSI